MSELLKQQFPGVIFGPEDLPSEITYEQLVAQVGGKAAGLLWIQKHLPEIPTAKMIVASVKMKGDTIDDAAEANGLNKPFIVRASSPTDNLRGHEGKLPTVFVKKDSSSLLFDSVNYVKFYCSENDSIIVAEASESKYRGTLVEHPHQSGKFLASASSLADRITVISHQFSFLDEKGAQSVNHLSTEYFGEEIDNQLLKIPAVYNQITRLPGIKQDMTFQLEFGLSPFLVFQLRDFMPKQEADFVISETQENKADQIVFGITPKEGKIYRVANDYSRNVAEDDTPLALYGELRSLCDSGLKGQANIFSYSVGLLAHEDIRLIRTTPLNIVLTDKERQLHSGDMVKITSDGRNFQLIKL